MSQKTLVSMVITEQDEFEVMQYLKGIESRLPGLISLASHGRRPKRMGDVEEGRARSIIRALKQNPQMVPPGLDLDATDKDFAALERLARIDDEMQRVAKLIGDTRSALGINIMSVAKLGYSLSKTFGAALGHCPGR